MSVLSRVRTDFWRPQSWSFDAVASCSLFIGALAYFHLTLFYSFDLADEGYLLFNIDRVASGQVPHRDFVAAYGPGVYGLNAPIYRFFGDRVLALREFFALIRAADVVIAYLIARHFVPRAFALLAAIFATALWGWFVWNLNAAYAALFTVPLCAGSLLLLLMAESRGNRRIFSKTAKSAPATGPKVGLVAALLTTMSMPP